MNARAAVIPVLALSAAALTAQLPTPVPTPRTAPRAHWTLLGGATGMPTQLRDNPGACSNSEMFVFGGRDGHASTTVRNSLFLFSGTGWMQRTPNGHPGAPPARAGAAIAYDPQRHKLVVFGGDNGSTTSPTQLFGDTWEYDAATATWADVTPPASPTRRRWSAMAFMPDLGRMILFGGETSTSPAAAPSAETWMLFDGAWAPIATAATPPARRQHSLVTRHDAGDIVLVAGDDPSTAPPTRHLDVWRFDGGNWVPIPTNGTVPHGTTGNQAVYDPIRRRLVLQGGEGISVPNAAAGGGYGDQYGGSPSDWCSEFDFMTNSWTLYGAATFHTNDPVIGRTSRYFAGFLPTIGQVVKWGGQNSSGTGTVIGTCVYQATPRASRSIYGPACASSIGTLWLTADQDPWTGRTVTLRLNNTLASATTVFVLGVGRTNLPLSSVHPAANSNCRLLVTPDLVVLRSFPDLPITLPNVAALAGVQVHAQAGTIEAGLVASSAGMTFTIGAL